MIKTHSKSYNFFIYPCNWFNLYPLILAPRNTRVPRKRLFWFLEKPALWETCVNWNRLICKYILGPLYEIRLSNKARSRCSWISEWDCWLWITVSRLLNACFPLFVVINRGSIFIVPPGAWNMPLLLDITFKNALNKVFFSSLPPRGESKDLALDIGVTLFGCH